MAAFVIAVLLVLVVASRQRSGLPTILSEAFLVDLRDRLQALGGELDVLGPAAFAAALPGEDRQWAQAAADGILARE